jgi:signal transduction histidine kinase
MAPSTDTELSSVPFDAESVMPRLAAATNQRSFFALLRQTFLRLLPGTRVDILTNYDGASGSVYFTSSSSPLPPQAATATEASLRAWLIGQGNRVVETLPLIGVGEHCGWLLLSRRRGALTARAREAASQIAPIIALRLRYDQLQRELAASISRVDVLEQWLQETEALRGTAMLAAGAAHNIRNLLTTVSGYAQMLEQDVPEPLRRQLALIIRATEDGQHLLRRLQLSRSDPDVIPPRSSTLLSTTIQESIEITQPVRDSRAVIAIETVLEADPVVHAPGVELREVLINLILNAVDAMPDGGTITIRAFAVTDQVIVEVTDTGQGIAREHQGSIFRPFTTTRATGTGLGLSISRAIVQRYGGTLNVHSAPGQGATFTFTLPTISYLSEYQQRELREGGQEP